LTEDLAEPAENYKLLRQWYLAHLRHLAQEDEAKTMATPASRIASDKRATQKVAASAAAQTIKKTATRRRYLFNWFLIFWLALQILFLAILSWQESSLGQGFVRFGQDTLMALVPGTNNAQFNLVTDRLCFACFFVLPCLVIALLPPHELSRLPFISPGLFRLIFSERTAAVSLVLLLALILAALLFSSQTASNPAQLTLAVESPAGPEHWLPGWICLFLTIPIIYLKSLRATIDTSYQKLNQIQAGIEGKSAAASPGKDLQNGLDALETSVQEVLQRESAIADFSRTVILSFNKDLKIEAISQSSFLQWGYHQHELIDENLSSIMLKDDIQEFADAIKSASGASFQHQARLRRGDNSIMDCLWFIDWSAKLGKFFAACEDNTDRMNMERGRNDFIAQLTHVRSPLTSVSMSLELIASNTPDDMSSKMGNTITTAMVSLKKILQLINDIMDGEKLRHSTQALQIRNVDIVKTCKICLHEMRSLAAESKLRLSFILSRDEIIVKADEKMLSRVITNLLSNAVSSSPAGSLLKVSLDVSSDSALVKITDEGPGIHQDYHQAIFERFGAPKSASMKERPTTAIGLSFCRDMVVAHGGLIGVESEPGKGSTFWFTMPLAAPDRSH
jgi:signal transduction histidine kinase